MRRGKEQQYPQVLAEIAVEVTRMLMSRGEEETGAMEFGFELAEYIRRQWSGSAIYIPRGRNFTLSKRDEEILLEFNGKNKRELCLKHSITECRLYQIVKATRIKQEDENKRIKDLPCLL